VLHCSDSLSNKVSNIIRRHIGNMMLLLICVLCSVPSADDGTVIRCDSVPRASLVRRGCTRVGEDGVWLGEDGAWAGEDGAWVGEVTDCTSQPLATYLQYS